MNHWLRSCSRAEFERTNVLGGTGWVPLSRSSFRAAQAGLAGQLHKKRAAESQRRSSFSSFFRTCTFDKLGRGTTSSVKLGERQRDPYLAATLAIPVEKFYGSLMRLDDLS